MKHKRQPILLIAILALMLFSSPALAAQNGNQEFEDITDEVSQVRGLEPLQPIEVTPFTREQLAEELQDTLLDDYPADERYADERELVAFGLLDEDVDLGELYLALYSEQVAGYYDTETGEMVVVRDAIEASDFTAIEEVTYAHEIVHALQDQHFDLDAGVLNREDVTDDRALAVTALIEGDASYSEVEYLLERPELLESFLTDVETMEFESEVLDSAPAIISATLLFPYDNGFTFIEAIYADGGWDAVNAMYENPPVSSEQILHPEKYLSGEQPDTVEVADFTSALEGDWRLFDDNTFGEFQIRTMLQQTSMSEEQATRASEGWGGDTYVVAGTETEDAIHWELVWDTNADADEFARAWALYEAERWGVDPEYISDDVIQFESDEAISQIILDGDQVTYLMAPNADILDAIAGTAAESATPVATPAS